MNFITILKKEILDNIYNFRYGIIVALSVLVIGTSVFTMYQDYRLRMENYSVLRPESSEAVAIIPPTPLSIFVKGLDENLSQAYQIDWLGIQLGSSQQIVNRLFKLFTTPDLLYIIKIVLSLCALLMAYDIVSREKEKGTLRIIFSNSLKRPVLLLGKWAGGFISFIVPIVLVLLFTIAIVSMLPMVQFTGSDYGKIFMFLIISIIYLAIFYTFGFFISCLVNKSVTSLILSIFFWAFVVFIIPNLGNTVSKQLVKTDSIEQLEQQQRLAWVKSRFYMINTGVYDGEISDTGWEKLSLAYAVEMNKQIQVSQNVAKISPAGVFSLLAADIMNTGLIDQLNLKNNVWEYYNSVKDSPSDSGGNLVGEFSIFSYQRAGLSEILSKNTLSIGLLLIFTLLFFVGAYAAFMKYDVR